MVKVSNFIHKHRRIFSMFGLAMCVMSFLVPSCFATGAEAPGAEAPGAVDDVLDVVTKFGDKALGPQGIGQKVITFITTNPICLIGLACFIMVTLVGLVRRFIIGA